MDNLKCEQRNKSWLDSSPVRPHQAAYSALSRQRQPPSREGIFSRLWKVVIGLIGFFCAMWASMSQSFGQKDLMLRLISPESHVPLLETMGNIHPI